MTEIKLKRACDSCNESDGLRVLVDRLYPLGAEKDNLHYDVWEKELAPSNELRLWLHEDPISRWEEFINSYEQELIASNKINHFINKIKHYNTITLIFASEDVDKNNALVLKDVLMEKLKEKIKSYAQ